MSAVNGLPSSFTDGLRERDDFLAERACAGTHGAPEKSRTSTRRFTGPLHFQLCYGGNVALVERIERATGIEPARVCVAHKLVTMTHPLGGACWHRLIRVSVGSDLRS